MRGTLLSALPAEWTEANAGRVLDEWLSESTLFEPRIPWISAGSNFVPRGEAAEVMVASASSAATQA